MFDTKQLETLNQELDNSRIKSRSKGNVNLSYIEGFDVIETANKVFGHGNWSYSISKLEQVSQEINQNENVVICYKAITVVTVHDTQHSKQINREDVGFGTGISKALADAHESGAKEAVTDAIKRSLRSFGNQFGNSLYDKSRNHQQNHTHQQSSNYNPQQQYQNPAQNQSANNENQTRSKTSFNQYAYQSLYNLGLNIVEQKNGFLIVTGDDIFSKKDSIKACGFRFDTKSKTWYKAIEGAA